MQLLYFITTVTSQVHSARHHRVLGTVLYRASSFVNDLSEFGMYNISLPALAILLGPWLGLLAITKTLKGELRYN